MNWYRTVKAQTSDEWASTHHKSGPPDSYLDVGHSADDDTLEECPVAMWFWDGTRVYSHDLKPGETYNFHDDIFVNSPEGDAETASAYWKRLFAGRYDKCQGIISASGNEQYRDKPPPKPLVKELYSLYPDAVIYYNTRGEGMQPVMAALNDCKQCRRKKG